MAAAKGGKGEKQQPLIIKKVKKGGHGGHHGGAWKIAYADFVTAMMAFFLLMWLLGSTTKGDLQGISDYFRTPLKVAMSGGSGAGDATSIIKGGGTDLTRVTGQVRQGSETPKRAMMKAAKAEVERAERTQLEKLKKKVENMLAGNPRLTAFKSQIRLDITNEGLRIQIVDDQNRPMFDLGSATLKDYTRDILQEIGRVLAESDHKLSMAGHTDSTPYAGGEKGYSNWELSAERANASRRTLLSAGVDEGKIVRVVGLASSVPLNREDPRDASNRRISIVVLNRKAEEALRRDGNTLDVTSAADLDAMAGETDKAEKADKAPASGAARGAPAEAAAAPVPAPIRHEKSH
jgi:chemotaxis protein MotB